MHKNDYQKKRIRALPDYISVISPNNYARIKIEDIETVEQDGRKLHIKTTEKNYMFYGTISTLAECLAERAFFRPLKSIIINLQHGSFVSGCEQHSYAVIFKVPGAFIVFIQDAEI